MAYSCVRVCFEIGHEASLRNKRTPEGFTHDWEVFVRGADNTDISQFVDRVIFHLHDTFPKPKRVVKEPPYSVKESGYAGFLLPIEVYFKNRDDPKKVLYNYDLQLQPSGPPLSKVLREKFEFPNPPEDLRRKLIRGGGVGVTGSESGSFIESPKPSASDEIVRQKHLLPLVGKPKLGGDVVKKHKSKDYRLDEPPRAKDPFADLFGPPIHKTKVSPDPKKSVSTSSKPSEKSGDKQNTGGKSSKHIPQKEVKETGLSTKEDQPKERSKDRDKGKDKPSKRSSTPPKTKPSSPKRSSSPKRPSTPTKHSVTPSSTRSPPHKRPPTPKLKFEEPKKSHEDSRGKSDTKSSESNKSEKKKKDKKNRDDKGSRSKEKRDESKSSTEKTEKSEKSKEFKEKEKKLPKETPNKEPEKTKENNITLTVDKDKEKQKHKHKKKDKNKHEESGKEKSKDRDKSSKKHSEKEKSHDGKDRDKNSLSRETEEKKRVPSPSVSPVRPSPTPIKPPTKERPAQHPLKRMLDELSDPESSDSSTSPLSEDETIDQPQPPVKASKTKDTYNQTSVAKAIQSIEDVVNNVSFSTTSSKAQVMKPKPSTPESSNATKLNGKQKEKSGSKKSKDKRESGGKSLSKDEVKVEKESKKRKRKDSGKGKDDIVNTSEPPEKVAKADVDTLKLASPIPPPGTNSEPSRMEVEEDPPDKARVNSLDQFTAEYVLQLKELQRKIMTLEDNAELQRVVQVIAETGQYEITKKTFDFDLCALDRTTVKRLQDFFAAS